MSRTVAIHIEMTYYANNSVETDQFQLLFTRSDCQCVYYLVLARVSGIALLGL